MADLYVPSDLYRKGLVAVAEREFGEDIASELVDHADFFAKTSTLAPNRCLELAIQLEREFGKDGAGLLLDEAILWVDRTAEKHHPHNLALYLKALIWVVNRHREQAS